MTLDEIGRLAVNQRLAQVAFQKACNKYDKARLSGQDNTPTYDPERLALLKADANLQKACDDFIETCVCYENAGDNLACLVHGGAKC